MAKNSIYLYPHYLLFQVGEVMQNNIVVSYSSSAVFTSHLIVSNFTFQMIIILKIVGMYLCL